MEQYQRTYGLRFIEAFHMSIAIMQVSISNVIYNRRAGS